MKRELVRALADKAENFDLLSVVRKDWLVKKVTGRISRMQSVQRDNAVYALDSERVSRRDFLKLIGLGGAGAAMAGAGVLRVISEMDAPAGYATHGPGGLAAAQDAGDYEVIEVGAGEFWQHRLGNGETFENVMFDITAHDAKARLIANASDWTIRNVGWRGRWDSRDRDTFILCTANGNCTIDNAYMGDGAATTNYPNSPNGIFVSPASAGTLDISCHHCQYVADNAIYGSGPGNGPEHMNPGRGGEVNIRNSYARDMQPAAFRVGTDPSTVENCVAVNAHRGGWAYYNNPTYRDCDFSQCQIADFFGGNGAWATDGVMTVQNCYGGTTGGNIDGQLQGPARRTEPSEVECVPLSAEEAAAGESSGEDLPTDTDPDDDDMPDPDDPSEEDDDDGPGSYPLPDDPEPAEDPIPPWERELEPPC